jgi:hypothetical protein
MAARPHTVFFALLTLTAALAAHASGPSFWTVATSADFLAGRSDGVFVSRDGVVTAGPRLTNRLASAPPQVWALALTTNGTLYAGTGGDGHVIRLRAGQPDETIFDASEPNVFAVAVSGTRIFAATGPDGRVHVIEADGTTRVFFDPSEKYVWALAVDRQDQLWVGAGNPAVIYRVDASGSADAVYRPPAAHVVTLAFDQSNRLLAGTDSPGRLYRLDEDGRPFVLLDSGLTELRAIAASPDGVLYAAAVGREGGASSTGEATSVAVTTATTASATAAPASQETAPATARSRVYRIAVDGTWEPVWETSDLVYDVAVDADGTVLAATGPEGRLYRLGPERAVSLMTGVDAGQLTRFARQANRPGVAAFATANPGRVVAIGSDAQSPATYLSSVLDTRTVATWGLIRWESTGAVTLSTRSGNTAKPDDSWSAWSAPYTRRDGEPVQSPAARFVQWRAVLETTAAGTSSLTAVTVAYLPRNGRPVVSEITVHPPGVVFQRPFANEDGAIAGLDDLAALTRRPPGDTGPPAPPPGRRMFQRGLQTLAWKAEDADGDRLVYALLYRRDSDATWHELRRGLLDTIFVWDTTTMADGRYVVRVDASDELSNSADLALRGQRESTAIVIDNTPPIVTVTASRDGAVVRLQVEARDAQSPIQKLEYSVAGSPWQLAHPVDGLADAPVERYDIRLGQGQEAALVVIRATDLLQNITSVPASR